LIAFVIALPNIVWQIERDWPTWVLLHGIAKSNKNVVLTPWEFFFQQITLMNPATFPLWFGGLIWLLVSHEARRYSVIAFTYLIALTEFVVMHGKNYYLAPAYPMIICRGWRCFREDFRAAHALAQTGDRVSRPRVSGRLRTCGSPHLVTGETARLYARDSFRGPTNGNDRILRHYPNSMPTNSAGRRWCAQLRGSTPACLRVNSSIAANFLPELWRGRRD
jgi:hypothetical protein